MSKKVLLVTGRLAEPLVVRYSAESSVETEVKTLPVSVATFMSSELLIDELKGLDPHDYSMLMVPGLVLCDLKKVEEELGLPTFRGPKYAADIPPVLNNFERIKPTKEKPACELLKSELLTSAKKILEKMETDAKKSLFKPYNFLVGGGHSAVAAGKDFPTRIIAEIADAPLLQEDEILATAERYLESGAEIVDIGMIAGKGMPDKVSKLISLIKDNFDVPVSIDTLNEEEIRAAVDAGVDMILSINGSTIDDFAGLEVPAVLVPIDSKRGYYPRAPAQRVDYLLDLVKKAEELGYARVVVDPILEPVTQGLVESLMAFYELRKREPDIPILMGVGNVIELYDADSPGMVALLVGAAGELNTSFLLTVEASDKTRGNVAEVRKAREMMVLARSRNSVPKDLGIDLLLLKDKKRISDVYDEGIEKRAEVIEAKPITEFKPYPEKAFRIFVRGSEIIAALYTPKGPEVVVKGKTAEEVCSEIARRGLVSDPEHAAYLGRELQKAEIAMRTGKGYIQDRELF